jgi:hypothetical protein
MNWLRYSGACVTLTLNPWHWVWLPRAYRESNREWPVGLCRTWRASWLFLTLRIWIDDGSW